MRLRITFAKTGALRYIGHLDLQTIWERTARRAALPLAYTQGFHPTPRIQIASALPLGFSGRAELVDLFLDHPDDALPPDLLPRLQAAAPPGLAMVAVKPVDERSPALQTRVAAACYQVTLLDEVPASTIRAGVDRLLAAGSLPRQRRGKPYDLRPLIFSLECDPPVLGMTLSASEGATGRPEEVLAELGFSPASASIERTRLLMKDDSPAKNEVE